MSYNILPYPKNIEKKSGVFVLEGAEICVGDGLDSRVISAAAKLKAAISEKTGGFHALRRDVAADSHSVYIAKDFSLSPEGYTLEVSSESIKISGGDDAGCFYGIGTLLQMLETSGTELDAVSIKDAPDMKYRGFYFDATRGRVPSVEGSKTLVDRLAKYKVNALQFYVEHVFDFKEFRTDIRTDDDYLTAEDIIEIDRYCYENFIDFQPSLSTFGHLYELLMKPQYKHLCELNNYVDEHHFWRERMAHHTIDPSNPESFEVICSLIDQYLPLFRSQYFNICCDETFDLCRGKNEGKDKAELYITFVSKIIEHVRAAGKTFMMWGDIALEHPELLNRIPEGTVLLNWEYSSNPNIGKIDKVRETGIEQIVCPGTSCWTSLVEKINVSVPNILKMAQGGYKNGVLGMLNTNWGDYGHSSHPECSLYGTVLGACVSWNTDTEANDLFEQSVSLSLYKTETNIVPFIRELGAAHNTAGWYGCFLWRWSKNNAYFEADEEAINQSVNTCRRIAEDLRRCGGDADIIRCLINAAEGIGLLNLAALDAKRDGAVSDEWRRLANLWFKEYEKCWLISSKPSEVSEIGRFIDNF